MDPTEPQAPDAGQAPAAVSQAGQRAAAAVEGPLLPEWDNGKAYPVASALGDGPPPALTPAKIEQADRETERREREWDMLSKCVECGGRFKPTERETCSDYCAEAREIRGRFEAWKKGTRSVEELSGYAFAKRNIRHLEREQNWEERESVHPTTGVVSRRRGTVISNRNPEPRSEPIELERSVREVSQRGADGRVAVHYEQVLTANLATLEQVKRKSAAELRKARMILEADEPEPKRREWAMAVLRYERGEVRTGAAGGVFDAAAVTAAAKVPPPVPVTVGESTAAVERGLEWGEFARTLLEMEARSPGSAKRWIAWINYALTTNTCCLRSELDAAKLAKLLAEHSELFWRRKSPRPGDTQRLDELHRTLKAAGHALNRSRLVEARRRATEHHRLSLLLDATRGLLEAALAELVGAIEESDGETPTEAEIRSALLNEVGGPLLDTMEAPRKSRPAGGRIAGVATGLIVECVAGELTREFSRAPFRDSASGRVVLRRLPLNRIALAAVAHAESLRLEVDPRKGYPWVRMAKPGPRASTVALDRSLKRSLKRSR